MTHIFFLQIIIPFSDDSLLDQFFPKLIDAIFELYYVVSEARAPLNLVNFDALVLPLVDDHYPDPVDLQVD